jgi:hypothetical protein
MDQNNAINVFLFGTCRIHIPFGCDYKCIYDNYNALNLFHTYGFMGPKYSLKEIIQFFKFITNKLIIPKELIRNIFTDCIIDDNFESQINTVKENFIKSDLIVIEISTLKKISTIFNNIEYQINLRDPNMYSLQHLKYSKTSEEELLKEIEYIQDILMNTFNKKVLFVTHYNLHNSIKSRQLIIDCCKKKAKFMFDPTDIINNNYPQSLKDSWHYSRETEFIIADELHKIIQYIFNSN